MKKNSEALAFNSLKIFNVDEVKEKKVRLSADGEDYGWLENSKVRANTEKNRAIIVCKKIGHQRPKGSDSNLIFAVFEQAVRDMYAPGGYREGAIAYLRRNKIRELEILGIDTKWARSQFKNADTGVMT